MKLKKIQNLERETKKKMDSETGKRTQTQKIQNRIPTLKCYMNPNEFRSIYLVTRNLFSDSASWIIPAK